MTAYVSQATAGNGDSHTPGSGSDTYLLWVNSGIRNNGVTSSAQDFGGSSMTELHDILINIAGGGDPFASVSRLIAPGTSSATLSVTYSASVSTQSGTALTFSGVDQTTPEYTTNVDPEATYNSSTAPSLGYDRPANSSVIYWRHHAAATAVTWTDPSGYTKVADITILATSAFRQLAVWVQDFTGSATGQTVAATSNNSGDGIHGVIVLQDSGGSPPASSILPMVVKYYKELN